MTVGGARKPRLAQPAAAQHPAPVVHVASHNARLVRVEYGKDRRIKKLPNLLASFGGGQPQVYVEHVQRQFATTVSDPRQRDLRVLGPTALSPADRQVDVALSADGKPRQRGVAVSAFAEKNVHAHGAVFVA